MTIKLVPVTQADRPAVRAASSILLKNGWEMKPLHYDDGTTMMGYREQPELDRMACPELKPNPALTPR